MNQSINRTETLMYKFTYAGLIVLALGIFTSVSATALSHILLFAPGIYFALRFIKNRDFKLSSHWWAMFFLFIVSIFSVLMNWSDMPSPMKNIIKTKYFLIALLSSFSFHYFKENYLTDKRIKVLIHLFLLSTSVATISGLIGLWSGFNPLKFKAACHATRACGLYGMYMTYGYGISMFMVLLTGVIVYRKRFSKWVNPRYLYIAWAINFVGLILSFARGGWIGFFCAVPFLFLNQHVKKVIGLFFIGIAFTGIAYVSSDTVQNMITKRSESNKQRLAFFETAYMAFRERPLFGYGYRNFEPNVKKLKRRYDIGWPEFGGHAHNNALEHLASTGALGFIGFILFCLLWLKNSYKEPILFAFVMSFCLSGLFQYTFGDGENLFFILGIFSFF
ncbi:MAG: hypothetical protein CME63_14545 [Halobacteriovoraceae bacterium]|nr:hypothetical protein [Halobacteriovoraceae bacterium]|tara:strand:+ start:977 stop:2149 length:1173 start_codon:yes stop_codon:yes gene_type:complete